MCVCARARVCACVCACVRASVRVITRRILTRLLLECVGFFSPHGESSVKLTASLYAAAAGLLYVVDSADKERLAEAREELTHVCHSQGMAGVPVVVLANKQDLPGKLLLVACLLNS